MTWTIFEMYWMGLEVTQRISLVFLILVALLSAALLLAHLAVRIECLIKNTRWVRRRARIKEVNRAIKRLDDEGDDLRDFELVLPTHEVSLERDPHTGNNVLTQRRLPTITLDEDTDPIEDLRSALVELGEEYINGRIRIDP